jgi:pantoate--beta-alanine ligase
MQVWKTVPLWMERRRAIGGRDVGFVPTMGALHEGHASLAARCRKESEISVASIFINPAQFNDPRDLDRYPRTMETDLELLERLGVDEVLAPAVNDLYPMGYRFRVEAPEAASIMEGIYRPGFFQGVMTIVLKLLNLVQPGRAYFGEKDYQQLRVITEMARDFFLAVEIVPCATVREPSGLAMSSRNRLLSAEGREKAAALYRTLTGASDSKQAKAMLEVEGFQVDYIEEHWGRRFAAAALEGVRLIDNVPLPKE